MRHIWEIQGVPIRFQPEEIVEYMGKRDGMRKRSQVEERHTKKKEGYTETLR